MEFVLGICGEDFAVLLADASAARSIIRFSDGEDKIYVLGSSATKRPRSQLLACAGPTSDRTNFCEYVQRIVELHGLRTGVDLTTKAIANFTRHELSTALRKGPYQTNLLLGGYDESRGASLYYCDYMGTVHEVSKAAHGYGSNFTLGILDRFVTKNITFEQAKDVLRKCIAELDARFLVHTPKYVVKVVDKDGARSIDLDL